MTAGLSGYRHGLVDLAVGRISREIFVNESIYREEQERVFARAWLFVGHESQIPQPGDFFVSAMGEESVILCRDRAGAVHPFHPWRYRAIASECSRRMGRCVLRGCRTAE